MYLKIHTLLQNQNKYFRFKWIWQKTNQKNVYNPLYIRLCEGRPAYPISSKYHNVIFVALCSITHIHIAYLDVMASITYLNYNEIQEIWREVDTVMCGGVVSWLTSQLPHTASDNSPAACWKIARFLQSLIFPLLAFCLQVLIFRKYSHSAPGDAPCTPKGSMYHQFDNRGLEWRN